MNDRELQSLVEEISIDSFERPFRHQARFNRRLRTTGGRYNLASHHLDFNPKVLDKMGLEGLEGVIKHELCHYHLHLEGKGHNHRDQDFKDLLAKTGGLRYVPLLEPEAWHFEYECASCGRKYTRKRKFDTRRYVCGKCKGKLILQKDSKVFSEKS